MESRRQGIQHKREMRGISRVMVNDSLKHPRSSTGQSKKSEGSRRDIAKRNIKAFRFSCVVDHMERTYRNLLGSLGRN